ncbi:DUF6279 family lipoprotein [Alteromonas gilva]|uniref:DUF6279 family lipoprotein n=1 Tax=Alteromonas gilva TaxID=2987522 RepID=A0ABT5L1R6_9ALTE|nr:DUF6279 family lipoprotein [Alteromonas gilva]MDC8830989.1 DUF6279 family lipoprotein [Alteromonas gilva]
MKKGLLIAIIFLLVGCSTKFTYNNLDWLIHWYIDDYVSLTDEQEEFFDDHFAQWQQWHRSEELSKYIAHLRALKADLSAPTLTAQQIEMHMQDSRLHWERLRDRVSPALAQIAYDLTDEQIESLFDEINDKNDEIRESLADYAEMSVEEQAEERLDNLEDDVSEYIGRLNQEQKRIIKAFAPEFNSTRALWLKYRTEMQQGARTLLANRKQNPLFRTELVALITRPEDFRSETYRTLRVENTRTYAKMAEQLFYTLDKKQKRKLIGEIDDMIEDLEYLMSNE